MDLCFLSATELARRIRARELSAQEVMAAHLAQIERVNPQVNAIVTLLPDEAMAQSRAADEALARGEDVGPLHGLPIAHKDLVLTKGIRTTFGSPIFADFVPDRDALIIERLKRAGAITIGKTNAPEFGAGSQTFNPVFGATRNPYDLSKHAAVQAVARQWRWLAACCQLPMAVTWADRCATRLTIATWLVFDRRRAACRHGRAWTHGPRCRSRGRWRAR